MALKFIQQSRIDKHTAELEALLGGIESTATLSVSRNNLKISLILAGDMTEQDIAELIQTLQDCYLRDSGETQR